MPAQGPKPRDHHRDSGEALEAQARVTPRVIEIGKVMPTGAGSPRPTATAASALGSLIESDDAVREAAYRHHADERTEGDEDER